MRGMIPKEKHKDEGKEDAGRSGDGKEHMEERERKDTYETTSASFIPIPPLRAFILCSCSRRHLYINAWGEVGVGVGAGDGVIY